MLLYNQFKGNNKIKKNKLEGEINMTAQWEMEKIKNWSTDTIKNYIWMAVACDQPIPGCVSVEALRMELMRRGEEPKGYHNT